MTRPMILILCLLATAAGAAGPAYWDSPQDVPFTDGELAGAALAGDGSLVAGFGANTVLADSSLVLWTVAPDGDDGFWVGSGHDGRVWHLDRQGRVKTAADLPVEEVFSLLPVEGGVLAGCGPGGQLHRIRTDGTSVELATVEGGYVWDLAQGPDGSVFLGTGSPAAIYRLNPDDTLEQLSLLPCSNVLDLAVMDDGTVLVAAQGPGRVFHLVPDREQWALVLALDQDEVRQLIDGPDGWYALGYQAEGEVGRNGHGNGKGGDPLAGPFDIMVTADADVKPVRSVLYRLGAVTAERLWSSEHVLATVVWSDDHGWLGAGAREDDGPSRMYALDFPNGRRPVATWEGGDVVDLVVVPRDRGPDEVLAAQAHPGVLTRLQAVDSDEAVFMSPPLDGRHNTRWGRLTWRGAAGGDQPRFSVRVGMSASPDESWTDWRDLGRGRDLDLADLPATRALQWRVSLPGGAAVRAVTVSGVEPNLSPFITHLVLEPHGELFRGGMMPGQDNVTQEFGSGLKVEYNLISRRDGRMPRQRAESLRPLRTFTWHASDPNEDRLQHRLAYRPVDQSDWRPLHGPTVEQVFTWDTRQLADGWYELRLITDDSLDNPGDQARATERRLPPMLVDNTAPEVSDWQLEHHPDGFSVSLRADDASDLLAGAQLLLPDGTVVRLDPVDGVCDSAREQFQRDVAFPGPGHAMPPRPWSIGVQVWDLQGNVAVVEGVLQ